jgi:hypothetical protein
MRVARFLARLVGWLLTPFIAWAASFIGAIFGASIARGVDSPGTGLVITLVCGAIAGLGTLGVVIHYLRRSPRLRHALHVTEDAIPDTSDLMEDETPAEKQP